MPMPVLATFQTFKRFAASSLNVMLPPLCMSCEGMVSESHGFCAACWKGLAFIAAPYCSCCGLPFEYEGQSVNEAALCGACLLELPRFKCARAAVVYNAASRGVLLPFKHNDRTDFAPALSRMMIQAGRGMLEECDMLIPVPLHVLRLFSRRYNQAAMLARALAKVFGKPACLDALIRHKPTPSQGHLSREQRYANVKNAFRVRPAFIPALQQKKIVLIDDVLTTGATANACAITLLKAGAAEVQVLTFARVVKAGR